MGFAHGGERVADAVARHDVGFIFTLTGGHIAPILTACNALGVRVVDVRDEANAVFAADAMARLTGIAGVAVVTAGPGVTNTLTALQNAYLAQSPLVLIGGAAATALRGRGALQDINQAAVVRPHVKEVFKVRRVRDLSGIVDEAFFAAASGVHGPVFVEIPVDLLYDEQTVRGLYQSDRSPKSIAARATRWYLGRHVDRLFAGIDASEQVLTRPVRIPSPGRVALERAAKLVAKAERPVLVVGSGAMALPGEANAIADAVVQLGMPTWLAGMARGLLGVRHPLHLRHRRREALRESDLVILAGMPVDFRLDYGRVINRKAKLITAGREGRSLSKNRTPTVGVPGDAGRFLQGLVGLAGGRSWERWLEVLRTRDTERDVEIKRQAAEGIAPINPLQLLQRIDAAMDDNSVIVTDGGDFVASASYVLQPKGPLRWLDPGVFGTLGVGAGFAMAAALARPNAEVWLLYGDGAAGFSLIEFDTFARHGIPVIAVVGNDAGWTQIARDQVRLLNDDVATVLASTDYERVVRGLGGVGLLLDDPANIDVVLDEAKHVAAAGRPVLINARIGRTEFRKGSMSM
ncbi:MAG: thiamine pyrophosphate-binding protein [Gammaproteobacteria bacterium]|nr:thiamine pyrophosphate-binding protein [Gammaproteobacteria bacterium]